MNIEKSLVVAKGAGVGAGMGVGGWDEQMRTIIYKTDKQQGPIA